ncbi:MAG: hypothetical protein QGI43_09145 [Gemmatimonadota bacterium]|jgi:hypothetical protein|nr:hypothetical protein [Gemmatimonadota bacterium]
MKRLTAGLVLLVALGAVSVLAAPPPPAGDWDWVDAAPPSASTAEKSVARALASSALFPGLGQRYVGHTRRATVFQIVETAVWTTFAIHRYRGAIRRDRMIDYAVLHGGANPSAGSDYYEHIGHWLSQEEWLDIVRRDARLRFPDDPAAQDEFLSQTRWYGSEAYWSWPDDDARVRFRVLRSGSERAFRNSRLAIGAAIFNRLVSLVDALAVTRGHNRRVREEQATLEWRMGPTPTGSGLVVGPVVTARY